MIEFLRDVQRLVTSGRFEQIHAATTVNRNDLEQMQRGAHTHGLAALSEEHARLAQELEQLKDPRKLELA